MSTGMASEDEIVNVVDSVRSVMCKEYVLLNYIFTKQALIWQANTRQLVKLGWRFDVVPGLSAHTLGKTVSVASVALGAYVIEKHFTLSHAEKGSDSEFSIEPDELERLC